MVKFYAPWCVHCKNLKKAYEGAAEDLKGVIPLVAVNCDEEKELCRKYEVNGNEYCGFLIAHTRTLVPLGYPTLKLFRNSLEKDMPKDITGGPRFSLRC